MKCRCVKCGVIIDIKGIDPQSQKCIICKEMVEKMNSKIAKTIINSIYGEKMAPKYKVGYRFKDGIDNEFEILERQWNGNIFIYAVGHIATGYINLLTEDSIDIIIGGANAKKPRKK